MKVYHLVIVILFLAVSSLIIWQATSICTKVTEAKEMSFRALVAPVAEELAEKITAFDAFQNVEKRKIFETEYCSGVIKQKRGFFRSKIDWQCNGKNSQGEPDMQLVLTVILFHSEDFAYRAGSELDPNECIGFVKYYLTKDGWVSKTDWRVF